MAATDEERQVLVSIGVHSDAKDGGLQWTVFLPLPTVQIYRLTGTPISLKDVHVKPSGHQFLFTFNYLDVVKESALTILQNWLQKESLERVREANPEVKVSNRDKT
jgi:hypothetical protein